MNWTARAYGRNAWPGRTESLYSPVVLSDPRPASTAGPSHAPGPRRAGIADTIGPVQEAKLQIQMLHDRVMVRADASGERRSGAGIVIPATAEVAKRLVWGEVFGVGQHVRIVKIGDRVLFARDDQYEVEVQGQTYLVLRERELHAVASERAEHGTGLYL